MSKKYEKLKSLLKEMFQLDQPDLDFGIYRIMHAKSAEITQFLDQDLLPQVRQELTRYLEADNAEIPNRIENSIGKDRDILAKGDTQPKDGVSQSHLTDRQSEIERLEGEVYEHLVSFFSRYYSEGDFLSKRRYSRDGRYAIPYDGEEVKLHWANHDQYYIKTSEYLRDYAFRINPNSETNPMRVHFRLVDATEGEHGDIKPAQGKERVFILRENDFISIEHGELRIDFEYRPADLLDWPDDQRRSHSKPPSQKDLSAIAETRILALEEALFAHWIEELAKPHILSNGEKADYTRVRSHLNRYVARNTFDYFIHKDLGGFLRRELDFYIKNEIMMLDDIENDSAPQVEQYLSKIKVIRRIAGKIITFLAQIEDFQKKLWLKKKFVLETRYLISLQQVPHCFYNDIIKNDNQWNEWKSLNILPDNQGLNLFNSANKFRSNQFLLDHINLMIDSIYFDSEIICSILNSIEELQNSIQGTLLRSENYNALRFMSKLYDRKIKCIYIDPPYNTGNDGFLYKDNYRQSSWLSFIKERVELGSKLLSNIGSFVVSIDDTQLSSLKLIMDTISKNMSFVENIIWKKRSSPPNDKIIGAQHEYALIYCNGNFNESMFLRPRSVEQLKRYKNPDNHPKGDWIPGDLMANIKGGRFVQSLNFSIKNPLTGDEHFPGDGGNWRFNKEKINLLMKNNEIYFGEDGKGRPKLKRFLCDVKEGITWTTIWDFAPFNTQGTSEMSDIFGNMILFESPKPEGYVENILNLCSDRDSFILDFFAGSGTTAISCIKLNRVDGGNRRFALVEMEYYFDTVILPRLKKVIFSPEWKDGKPERNITNEAIERGPKILKIIHLESYEDTLNNIQLKRSEAQANLLDHAEAKGSDKLREQYLLQYMLNIESEGSPSLLNIKAFTDPTAYRLKVKRPGSDESREVCVDLIETFNWLIGLTVWHLAAPQVFSADFIRNSENRLEIKDRIVVDPGGPFWFRTVTGTTPNGDKALIIWRKLTGDPEKDNSVLNFWFTKQGYSSKDTEFDVIYVNGGNNLENLKTDQDTWKVRLIEEDFHRLMFDTEDL